MNFASAADLPEPEGPVTKHGISVPVSKVDRDFSYSQEFQVEFKEPEPEPVAPFVPPPLPALTTVPELTPEAALAIKLD